MNRPNPSAPSRNGPLDPRSTRSSNSRPAPTLNDRRSTSGPR
ncbi:hypothetical protein [Phenylobacterium sp.]|jgi:hypothetical protein|nr:hypothetical protein [Phenylobacterium sp.]HEX2560050.1 hypothetical protein [Phenylobacterium sp.]